MPLVFDGKSIQPAPFVQIQKTYNTIDAGEIIGSEYQITLNSSLVAYKGSPQSSGHFHTTSGLIGDETIAADARLQSILHKQQALRELFSSQNEGKSLEVSSPNGSAPLKCNPRIKSITFDEGPWTEVCKYQVILSADQLYLDSVIEDTSISGYFVSKYDEQWSIEPADDIVETYRLSRQLSAVGKNHYDSDGNLQVAWREAERYLLSKIGLGIDLNRVKSSGVLDLDLNTYQAFNYTRNESVNEGAGSVSIGEHWLVAAPSGFYAIEDFEISTRIDESNRIRVTANGTIKGLEQRNNTTFALISTKYDNAIAKFNNTESLLFNRCSTISGHTLNPQRVSFTKGVNEKAGVITYNVNYDDRPSNVIANAISETIQLTYEGQTDVVASIIVLNRVAGSVLQSIGTFTDRKKNLTIEAVLPAGSQTGVYQQPNTAALVTSYMPVAAQVFKERDVENWSPTTGRYSRSISWIYQ